MEIDQVLGNDTTIGEGGAGGGSGGGLKITNSTNNKKKNNNLFEVIQKENEEIKEILKKTHDYIREAIVDQSKEVVAEILQQINPRLEEIENKLEEIKSEIRTIATSNEGEGESEAGGNIEEEQVEQQQQNIQPPLQQNQNRQEAREVVNGRGRARGNSRARDARMFYLLRQLDRERGFNDRYSPFRGNGGGNRANNVTSTAVTNLKEGGVLDPWICYFEIDLLFLNKYSFSNF